MNNIFYCPDFFGHRGKWIDQKAKMNSKIYVDTNFGTNNYNRHIARYLKK